MTIAIDFDGTIVEHRRYQLQVPKPCRTGCMYNEQNRQDSSAS